MKKNEKKINLSTVKEERIDSLLHKKDALLSTLITAKKHKEILSAKETMELLDISRNTFDRYRKQGILKAYKLNKKIYCKYSEILEILDQGFQEVA